MTCYPRSPKQRIYGYLNIIRGTTVVLNGSLATWKNYACQCPPIPSLVSGEAAWYALVYHCGLTPGSSSRSGAGRSEWTLITVVRLPRQDQWKGIRNSRLRHSMGALFPAAATRWSHLQLRLSEDAGEPKESGFCERASGIYLSRRSGFSQQSSRHGQELENPWAAIRIWMGPEG